MRSTTEPRPVVLVADDDEQIRALFEVLLDSAGFKVLLAENGTRALDLAVRKDPDIILLDVNMPAPDGYETTRRLNLHEKTGGTPVVLMSGAGDSVDRVRALRAGAVDFLLKPVHAEELQAKMKSLLRLRRYNQSLRRSREELAAAGQAGGVEQALAAFARFVPREMLDCLEKGSVLEVRLGDQVLKEMAVLFSDIRSFTALSEKMTPQENFNFLNSYLKRMNPYIWENHGFIDKYIGDAIMALFPGGAENALKAALGMIRHLPGYNIERATFGYDPIRIGIGLHVGPVMLGMIGHERFMQATVISDAVNLASRMERLTKLYGVALLLSSPVIFGLTDPTRYAYRFLDKIRVRGKDEPVSVFEVFDADPPETVAHKIRTRDSFEKGVFEYHRNNVKEAAGLFAAIATAEMGDRPLEIYRERCAYHKKFGIRKDVITEEGF